jgi:hypothetical protein
MWRAFLDAAENDCAAFLSPRHSDSENALTWPTGVFFDEEVAAENGREPKPMCHLVSVLVLLSSGLPLNSYLAQM